MYEYVFVLPVFDEKQWMFHLISLMCQYAVFNRESKNKNFLENGIGKQMIGMYYWVVLVINWPSVDVDKASWISKTHSF